MKVLEEVAIVAGNTYRTKAYLQIMCREGIKPAFCLFFEDEERLAQAGKGLEESKEDQRFFNPNEDIVDTLKKNEIPYQYINTRDIHSREMVGAMRILKQKYLIYSGYGGVILKPVLFDMGKKIIHVHAGELPAYRGSTTAYYSLLQEGCMGATAIFMNEKLDEGEILWAEKFDMPPKEVNIDLVYEPYTRATVLANVLKSYVQNQGAFDPQKQMGQSETYFIIHPLLKHIALMRLK